MKKLNKLFAILVAMAMVLSLTVISAFAATGQRATDEDHPASAKLTKVLKVPTGTTITSEKFNFSFTQATEGQPATYGIDPLEIDINAADKVSSENGLDTYVDTIEFPAATVVFPEPGVYTYTVKEVYTPDEEGGNTKAVEVDTNKTKTYEYDTANADHYTVKFGVATKSDGETTYVESIGVYDKNDNKVNAGEPEGEDDANGFKFENKITTKIDNVTPQGETTDPNNTNDKIAFDLTKAVTKATGSKDAPAGQKFAFNVVLTKSALDTTEGEVEYAAQIVSKDSQTKKDVTLKTGTEGNDIKLADGERLVLKEVDVGVGYQITEASYPAFTTNDNMTQVLYISDSGNTKGFTNEYNDQDDPGTGLSIANLPFIVLALVAVGGLVAYVIVRRKSEDNA